MAMQIANNYSSYVAHNMVVNSATESTKKKETENTTKATESSKATGSSKAKSTSDYVNKLAKLVPSVEFRVGNACVSDKSGKSLTVNPKLLEKMQNNPEKEKDMKDMIKGVESMSKLAESIAKATGWTIVYQHSYIDENGKYHCRMQTRNDFMLNMSDKLREDRRKNSEKLIEKTKGNATEEKEELKETLEEKEKIKIEEETEEKAKETAYNMAEQLINEKMAASNDGTIYLNDTDIWTIIEATKEDDTNKTVKEKEQVQVGANLDLKI